MFARNDAFALPSSAKRGCNKGSNGAPRKRFRRCGERFFPLKSAAFRAGTQDKEQCRGRGGFERRGCDACYNGGPVTPGSSSLSIRPGRPAVSREDVSERQKKLWYGLTIASSSAAGFDAWSTRRAISGGYGTEANPMLAPFAHLTRFTWRRRSARWYWIMSGGK